MEELIDTVMTWRHSGFNVFCGPRIQPGEQQSMENLARYIIRVFLSRPQGVQRRSRHRGRGIAPHNTTISVGSVMVTESLNTLPMASMATR